MEKYTDYLRCGEIYKSPSQSDKTPYILKCFRCSDVFLLLESFIFHIEDYCQKEDPSTSTAVATIKSEPVDAGQTFSIEMIEENYSRHDAVECKEEKYSIREIEEDVVCIENDVDCEIIEDSAIEIKNEPVVDSDEVCGDAVDVYISDVFDDSNDDQNEVEHSGDEEVQGFGFQSLAEDTESADEDVGKTFAEKRKASSKRYREELKKHPLKMQEYRAKDNERKRKYRKRMSELTKTNNKLLKERREKDRLRQKRNRDKKKSEAQIKKRRKPYERKQALGKAVEKVEKPLPVDLGSKVKMLDDIKPASDVEKRQPLKNFEI